MSFQYDVGVIGGYGKAGLPTVEYLTRSSFQVVAGGRNVESGKQALAQAGLENAAVCAVDIFDETQLAEFCRQSKVIINCAGPSHRIQDRIAAAAAESGSHFFDVGVMEILQDKVDHLKDQHRDKNLACIYGTGLHPGLDDLFALHCDRQARDRLDHLDSLEIFFGDKTNWEGQGSLEDVFWGIHEGGMSLYFGYYQDGKWVKGGLFNGFRKESFDEIGRHRYGLMFQPLLKPLAKRYRKVATYGWVDMPTIMSSMYLKFFIKKKNAAKGAAYLENLYRKRRKKFATIQTDTFLYCLVKGERDGAPKTLRFELKFPRDRGYWSVGVIPAIAARFLLEGKLNAVGPNALAEVAEPSLFIDELTRLGLTYSQAEVPPA